MFQMITSILMATLLLSCKFDNKNQPIAKDTSRILKQIDTVVDNSIAQNTTPSNPLYIIQEI